MISGLTHIKSDFDIKEKYYICVLCETSEGIIEQSAFYSAEDIEKYLPALAHIFYNESDNMEDDYLNSKYQDIMYEIVPYIDSPNYAVYLTQFIYIDKNGKVKEVVIDLPEYQI